MASAILSRWPVRVTVSITEADLEADDRLTTAAAQRCFAVARDAYFAKCTTLDPAAIEVRDVAITNTNAAASGATVTVSVSVVEIFPDIFTMNMRIRPEEGDGIAADGTCTLSLGTGQLVTDAIRDEFIALAHGARYMH